MKDDIGPWLGGILYNIGQIAISQAHTQTSDESTTSRLPQSERSSPLLDHPVPSVSSHSHSISSNGPTQERFEAKEVSNYAGLDDEGN